MIRDTYAEFILEKILMEILLEGENPSVSEITSRFNTFTAANDISQPLFTANDYKVVRGTSSSASLYNNTNQAVLQDFKVLYRHLFKVSDQTINNFERWKTETKLLEGKLEELQERISSLLFLASDTEGFFNFMQDNFVDTSKVDLENSTAYVNVDKGVVSIGTSSIGATRHDLSDLKDTDLDFTILSKNNLVSSVSSPRSKLSYVVSDVTNFWQERVYANKPGPVSVELKIDLLEEKQISRIDIDLHMANTNSSLQITPMYSTDNFNYSQLPISNFTRSIVDKSVFQFTPVTARYIKFIMTKAGFDVVYKELYAYEFGVDEISLYNEGFAANQDSTLISKSLSVLDTDGNPEEFSKLTLETCEDVPDGTNINYFIGASNTENLSVDDTVFVAIDPLNRESSTKPTVLDFGELEPVTVSEIHISYAPTATSGVFINPAQSFSLISAISGTTAVVASGEASAQRYSFFNTSDRVLDHAVGSGVLVAQGTLELWRNVNQRGTTTKVRSQINGWGFEDPYYKTTVYVDNPQGTNIDFGGKPVILDGARQGGKISVSTGKHIFQVHKDNWKVIDDSAVTDLASLKVADTLYPYNHRYLIEGFSYPSNYPDAEEQIYKGFDIVAEYLMKEVSVFDMINNVTSNDYEKYAIDLDAEDTSRTLDGVGGGETTPLSVFLLKVDENNSDFINEEFLLKFKSANTLYKYLRLKAVLTTTDTSITPMLDSYRIKISS